MNRAEVAEVPEYDIARAADRPFAPAPAMTARFEEGPVTRVRLWDGSTPWLVTRYAEHRALLSDSRVSVDPAHPGLPRFSPGERLQEQETAALSFIMMDDPEHARLRRMVIAPFAIRRVEAMRPGVQRIVDDTIDRMLSRPRPVDLVEALALPVPSLVISELLGVPYEDHQFFQDNSKTIISRSARHEERMDAFRRLGEYLGALVGQKLAQPGDDDLLSRLAERIRAGELSPAEAVQMGVLMLIAGHETTANMIALGTLALLRHPQQLARLRDTDDPQVVASGVEELLRYLTITHGGLRRVAVTDIEIGGQTIRAGDGIILVSETANRDPAAFPDPEQLDLERDARHHVTFGHGVHQCLGQSLARMELQVVYPTLLKRIPGLRLAAGIDEIPFKGDGFVYGVYELPVTW